MPGLGTDSKHTLSVSQGNPKSEIRGTADGEPFAEPTEAETGTGRTDCGASSDQARRNDRWGRSALDELAESKVAGGAALTSTGAVPQFLHCANATSLNGTEDFRLGDLQATTNDAIGRKRIRDFGSNGDDDGWGDRFHRCNADRAAKQRRLAAVFLLSDIVR